ncbi:RNP-1 like RNA-binding protein [Nitzschia inconspicua]|uniref:RNP-1 like RNA-binding protein n=1 Tax=Nitzschia inconspicua TaxID=303405 RepID=A0A9K3KV52_9STRA|nr:RNP-1 like RNA-binding protein [Nitzschia inconspicua]
MNEENDINQGVDWHKSITSVLTGESSLDTPRQVKKLRKLVLLSLQMDESDKNAKKQFKKAIQAMEKDGTLLLDADGNVDLVKKSKTLKEKEHKKKKRKSSKEEKKSSKKQKKEEGGEDGNFDDTENISKEQEQDQVDESESNSDPTHISSSDKNKPCKGNPQGVTRLFLGNLPFAVDESSLSAFLPGTVTHIKWITDKETGKFYGSAFVEMDNSESAAEAVAMAGSKLIGRPVKINFAPARDGDVWPPPNKVVSGGTTTGGQAGGKGIKAMSAKPDNCVKLFIGNLSYDIDDEGITKFFASVDAEVKAVRWIHHRDSGDFKGVGFVEFWNTEACEKAATLNGKNLLGRPIRIDWTD